MKSNENEEYDRSKVFSTQSDNKSSQNQNDKMKSAVSKRVTNKTKADEIIEKPHNNISNNYVKEIKQFAATKDYTKIDRQTDSKQIMEKTGRQHSEPSKQNTYNRFPLNSRNYITELHRVLLKECEDNLLDLNLLNATLDDESLTNVTHRTLRAIKDFCFKNQKIFSVLGYFPKISEELKNRGWVEKRDPYRSPINYLQYLTSTLNWIESPPLLPANSGNEVVWERLKNMQSWSILKDRRSDLIFVTRKRLVNWSSLHELTSVSQMARHAFCTKNGLAQCLEPYKYAVTNLMFPRCHYIRNKSDYDAFLEDYIITALIGTLKIIVQAIEKNERKFSEKGNIPYDMIYFVKRCVFKFLNKRQTGCAEIDMWKFESEIEIWNEFLNHYTKLISNDNATFHREYTYQLELDVYSRCKYLLDMVKIYCPQHYIDGNTNTWIIKPTSNCSGHGILLSRDLNKIKEKTTVTDGLKNNIVQKYIEKPLLIYSCKIDLRQWFLVTNMNPVVIWMYKEGYVRFCANSFSMKNMHESIHLSNVRLQMKYRKMRSLNVPEECMWNFEDLKNYLMTIGQEHVWDDLIFPGMSESIYAVLQATTENSFYRPKSFQLFGADFVLTDSFIPYLIEINSIPGLNPSTSVIANLTPMLLGDIIKVIVDFEENSNADTGLFVKVVPEKWKPVTTIRGPTEGTPFSPPKIAANIADPTQAYYYYPHRRWVENVNDKLAAIRFRINARETPIDRYFGYNRDTLLMTAAPTGTATSVTTTSTDINVETVKNSHDTTNPTTRETILNDMHLSAKEKMSKLKTMYGPKLNDSHQIRLSKLQNDLKKR
ncbi:Tubulin-tyrosine ligase/Tubulin polyglutamylase [Cinara cedri]|uniref:Tubulin-tyrosine ligase/Tubulin polyglutamylase n=1 Tax=Cinara cedri TaxID=506608 RepID=A0A5E4N1L3_9HEMI|nr:Tubulin-tyrosine ligase/Tubulin polyglutamylase [Cinara cedri]